MRFPSSSSREPIQFKRNPRIVPLDGRSLKLCHAGGPTDDQAIDLVSDIGQRIGSVGRKRGQGPKMTFGAVCRPIS